MKKRFLLILLLLAAGAAVLRFKVCYELADSPRSQVENPSDVTDMYTYKEYATQIVEGEFSGPLYYQPFYYVVFLPVIHLLSAGSVWGILIVQSLLGAATVYLTGVVTAICFGKRAGIAASGLLIFSSTLLLLTAYRLIATLQAFWIVLLCYLLLRALATAKWRYWIGVGIVTGTAILTRGNIWFFVPGILVASVFASLTRQPLKVRSALKDSLNRAKLKRSLLIGAAVLGCIIVVQAPFSIYNTIKLGTFTGPSTAASAVLALGNTPEAPAGGRNPGSGPGPMEYPPTYSYWMDHQHEQSVFSRAMAWFADEPMAFLELQFRKILLFWDYREIPNNVALEGQGTISKTLRLIGRTGSFWQPFGIMATAYLVMLGLGGLFLFCKRMWGNWRLLLLAYFIVAYWFATAAFYNLARFRAPILPLLAVFGAGLIICIARRVRNKQYSQLLKRALPAVFGAVFITYLSYDLYRTGYEAAVMRLVRPDGTRVQLGESKLMYLDNGPLTLGGWQALGLENGQVIEKSFVLEQQQPMVGARLGLNVAWQSKGRVLLQINGRRIELVSTRTGINEHTITIPPPAGNVVQIKLLRNSANIALIVDTQRNYGRTKIDGKTVDGELVCRLYCDSPTAATGGK